MVGYRNGPVARTWAPNRKTAGLKSPSACTTGGTPAYSRMASAATSTPVTAATTKTTVMRLGDVAAFTVRRYTPNASAPRPTIWRAFIRFVRDRPRGEEHRRQQRHPRQSQVGAPPSQDVPRASNAAQSHRDGPRAEDHQQCRFHAADRLSRHLNQRARFFERGNQDQGTDANPGHLRRGRGMMAVEFFRNCHDTFAHYRFVHSPH